MVFFDFQKFPLADVLPVLLADNTTGKNIIFATDEYKKVIPEIDKTSHIREEFFTSENRFFIEPRVAKKLELQQTRTRQKAEVFTPSWICNRINNNCDELWFGRKNVFNEEIGEDTWKPSSEKILFGNSTDWKRYVELSWLEITCGEAPFIASRYDTLTGKVIPVEERIGVLDRKVRIVSENATSEEDWMTWTIKAFQSVYGYEFQGDNLLIARCNLLLSFIEYAEYYLHRSPSMEELNRFAEVISWNFWQMDGLTGLPPFKEREPETELDLFHELEQNIETAKDCVIFDWRNGTDVPFVKRNRMKFDFVIGNPPYQEEKKGTSDSPVYHYFMQEAYKLGKVSELITPARFLFDAGKTPKPWNKKMLNDKHFNVLFYAENSKNIFPTADIKGGIAITVRDEERSWKPIKIFTKYDELKPILQKVTDRKDFLPLSTIVFAPESYKLSQQALDDFPEITSLMSKGHSTDLTSNLFDKLAALTLLQVDNPKAQQGFSRIFGLKNKERCFLMIKSKYLIPIPSFSAYKIFLPKSSGSGTFGERLTKPVIGAPNVAHTQSFISIGSFQSEQEAVNLSLFLQTKFARALLGVMKATQDNKQQVWKFVPIQDFTPSSDIDWAKPVSDIDQQLYAKYGLSDDDIQFIETRVKEMN